MNRFRRRSNHGKLEHFLFPDGFLDGGDGGLVVPAQKRRLFRTDHRRFPLLPGGISRVNGRNRWRGTAPIDGSASPSPFLTPDPPALSGSNRSSALKRGPIAGFMFPGAKKENMILYEKRAIEPGFTGGWIPDAIPRFLRRAGSK